MIGLKRGTVELADHDPEWERLAVQTIERLWCVFGSVAKDIQHVGSTAIKEIKAKPVIDIAVAVFNFDDVLALSPVLAEQGFMCVGWENDEKVQPMYQCGEFITGEKLPRILTHFIHIVMAESQQWHDYINHRDYMNTCPAVAHEYELLKLQLKDENSDNYHNYFLGKQEYIQKAVKTARLWDDLSRKFIQITPIAKGWSEDKKYCVEAADGTKYLLRVTPIARYETRKALFSMLERVAALDIPMCRPLVFGTCNDGVYALHSWIDGENLETVLPKLTEIEQYVLGLKSGEIARKMHSIPAPDTQEDWESRFNRKTNTKIQKYRECGLRFDGDEYVLSYLEQNRHLLKNHPQCFQHGDYHVGNMMIENGDLKIIDFDRYDFGDPWEEFNRIVWSAAASPHFATGQLQGYFGGEPPMEFFKLLAFYIARNTLSSIYWAVPFGPSDLDTMMKQARDVLTWFDNMNNPVPTWYLGEYEIWDVLDANGNKTGRYHERGKPMASGDYHLCVHVWKHNGRGEWLIDKRTDKKGGKWETTGGAAIAGDDSLTAALRETKEELGIVLDPAKGVLFRRFAREGFYGHTYLMDVWVFEHDCAIEDVRFQERETCDAVWATAEQIRLLIRDNKFFSDVDLYFDEMVDKW